MSADWMRDPSKTSVAAGAAIFIIGIVIANNFLFAPLMQRNDQLRQALGLQKEKRDMLQTAAALDSRLKKQGDIFASSRSAGWIMAAVKSGADASGVKLVSVTPQNPERQGRFWKIPVLIEAECGYHELGRFAANLESLPKLVKIDRVRAETSDPLPADGVHPAQVTLSVSAYYPDLNVS